MSPQTLIRKSQKATRTGRRPYPARPGFWANQVQRALITSEAVSTLGRDACWLIMFIAAREDMLFYKQIPRWWTQQLMDDSGFTNKSKFLKTRQAAIDAGWIVMNGGGKGIEGEYFTDIPPQFLGANSPQQTEQQEVSRCESAPANAPPSEPTNASHPIPSTLVPREAEEGDAPPSSSTRSMKMKTTREAYSLDFESVWIAYPAIRRRNKGKAYHEYQAALKRVAEADSGDIPKAAAWILAKTQEFAGSHCGQKYAPEPERWFHDDRFYDAPEAWGDFGDGQKLTGNASFDSEAEQAWTKLLSGLNQFDFQTQHDKLRAFTGERIWASAAKVGWQQIRDRDQFTQSKLKPDFIREWSARL